MKNFFNLFFVSFVVACSGKSNGVINTNKILGEEDVAIKGYDPVAYFTQSKPIEGKKGFSTKHDDAVWYFSSYRRC